MLPPWDFLANHLCRVGFFLPPPPSRFLLHGFLARSISLSAGENDQRNYSKVTQWPSRLRCIVLHPVDTVETRGPSFVIALQSPWRHCSCNCAARLARSVRWDGLSFSQTPVAFQLGKEKYFHLRRTGSYLREKQQPRFLFETRNCGVCSTGTNG